MTPPLPTPISPSRRSTWSGKPISRSAPATTAPASSSTACRVPTPKRRIAHRKGAPAGAPFFVRPAGELARPKDGSFLAGARLGHSAVHLRRDSAAEDLCAGGLDLVHPAVDDAALAVLHRLP